MLKLRGDNEQAPAPVACAAELAHLIQVLEKQPACLVRVALDGALLAVNEAALCLLGVSDLGDVLDESLVDRFLPGQQPTWLEFSARVWSEGTGSVECKLVDGTGRERRTLLQGLAQRGNPDGIDSLFLTIRDVSATRRLEESVEDAARSQDLSKATDSQLKLAHAECERLRAAFQAAESERARLQELLARAASDSHPSGSGSHPELTGERTTDIHTQLEEQHASGMRAMGAKAQAMLDALQMQLAAEVAERKRITALYNEAVAADEVVQAQARLTPDSALEAWYQQLDGPDVKDLSGQVEALGGSPEGHTTGQETHAHGAPAHALSVKEEVLRDIVEGLKEQLARATAERDDLHQQLMAEREAAGQTRDRAAAAQDEDRHLVSQAFEQRLAAVVEENTRAHTERHQREAQEARDAFERQLQLREGELQETIRDLENQLQQARDEVARVRTQAEAERHAAEGQLRHDYEAALAALRESGQQRAQELLSELSDARGGLQALQGDRDALFARLQQAEEQLQQLRDEHHAVEQQLRADYELALAGLRDESHRREQESHSHLVETRQTLEHLRREHDAARAALDSAAQHLSERDAAERELRQAHELTVAALREEIQRREQEVQSQVAEARRAHEQLQREYSDARAALDSTARLLSETKHERQALEDGLRQAHDFAVGSLREEGQRRAHEHDLALAALRQESHRLQQEHELAVEALRKESHRREQELELSLAALREHGRDREREFESRTADARQAQERLQQKYDAVLAELHSGILPAPKEASEQQAAGEQLRQEHELALATLHENNRRREQQLQAQLAEAHAAQERLRRDYDAALAELHKNALLMAGTDGQPGPRRSAVEPAVEAPLDVTLLADAVSQKNHAIRTNIDMCSELETLHESLVALSPLAVAGRIGRELGSELQRILVSLNARTRRVLTLTSLEADGREELETLRKDVLRAWILGQQLSDACGGSHPDSAGRE